MRILVTWGSKRGGTEGIARMLADFLRDEGLSVDLLPPAQASRATTFDAAIVGGALYANRWHSAARRFVNRQERRLRQVPVWFFSSGPLDDSAERQMIPPTEQVQALMERVGARGHATFGGRLDPDARGFPASAMAKKRAGDWRRPEQVRIWASAIARALPTARPGVAFEHPGRSLPRLALHGLAGWAACATTMGALLAVTKLGPALFLHALAGSLIFAAVGWSYFGERGARDPLPTALTFAGMVAALDLVVVAGFIQRTLDMFQSIAGFWLPLFLIFVVTLVTGELRSTMPSAKPRPPHTAAAVPH